MAGLRSPFAPRRSRILLEAGLVAVITAAVSLAIDGLRAPLQQGQRAAAVRLQRQADWYGLLRELSDDLQLSSTEPDPLTQTLRYDAAPADGFSYRTIDAVTMTGNELAPLWSTPIRIRVTADGRVVREHAGSSRVLATGVEALRLAAVGGRFVITCTLATVEPDSGRPTTVVRTASIATPSLAAFGG